MPPRYLFGPVTAAFARDNLRGPRQSGHCLAFDHAGETDLRIGPEDTWESACARLPSGWRPDLVVLSLGYATVPACLWAAPVPLVGWAWDWNLLWHDYRRRLRRCDLAFTDAAGVQALAQDGYPHARPANLYGCARPLLEAPPPDGPRDIDVLFVGNLHPAVQRERLPWLARLARLADRWNVVIRTGVFGEDYYRLLARARVAFNRSIRGECNLRAFEAAAAGALLFQEAGNREVPAYFQDRRECVSYADDDLEELLEHYLSRAGERRALAEAARAKVARYGFEAIWQELLGVVEREWPALRERAARRPAWAEGEGLLARLGQAQSSTIPADPALGNDLAAALARGPQSAALHNALGLAVALAGQGPRGTTAGLAGRAAGHFQRALACDPAHVLAGLNLAEALTGLGRKPEAADQARRTLAVLDGPAPVDPSVWDAGHFPPGFDHFRVEWERAAWQSAGRPAEEVRAKRELVRWRLHALLADLTDDPGHHYEAVVARPDLPTARTALGVHLARAGRVAEALPHLRRAHEANPFDGDAACSLFHVLGALGDEAGQRRLARDRRLLARAAPQLVPAEDWFVQAPPVGDELASVIVLCCGQLEYTRACLESVLLHTRPPYELVVVDNGSADGTPPYLEGLHSRPGPARVEVVRNETNRGAPAGRNQGVARARGRYLAFLDNDAVVTAGWLEGLIAWALHDWPAVGMVGAVTNYSAGPQQVPADYADRDGLDAFAGRRRRAFAGKAVEAGRLPGFCLLARREALERAGGFDECYGLGCLEDDDLGLRVRDRGFRLLLALNVFVHHFGRRTFAGLGLDLQEQRRANAEVFKAIWGAERTAAYLPGGQDTPPPDGPPPDRFLPVATRQGKEQSWPDGPGPAGAAAPRAPAAVAERQRVSLCLIVRNEEANLPACLGSAAGLADEVVVVDTGSTDRTKEVAASFGARVFDFAWVDSFAAARNESLRRATGDWAFWLDADDRLDDVNRDKLRALFGGLQDEGAAYVLKCLCLPDPETETATVVDHVRLFRRHPDLRWEHRVHEQILPALRRLGYAVRWADALIHHRGYEDPALRRRKLERDLRLLRLEDAEQPGHPFTLFNLGSVYQELGRHAEALPLLARSLERSHPGDSIVRKLYALIVGCHRQLGRPEEALAACRAGLRHYPEDAELLFLEGLALKDRGDREGAEAAWLRLLAGGEGDHFASVDAGLRGYKARHNLAVLYREAGRALEAEGQWRAALAERPQFAPAWLGLGELCLAQGRWRDLEAVADQLRAAPRGEDEAAVLRARTQLARREFAAARRTLEVVIARAPEALWPRVVLTHVLLQEGLDWAAAEKALRDVLALDPNHAEARRNLAVLLRQLGRIAEAAHLT